MMNTAASFSRRGKTGTESVRIIKYARDLIRWLDIHPMKDDPNAFAWIRHVKKNGKYEVLANCHVTEILKEVARKVRLDEPVNPHAF